MTHEDLKNIPSRFLDMALNALSQANTHAVCYDPGKEHWDKMSVLNTALAGELCLKAIIATGHHLLVFRDLFKLEQQNSEDLSIEHIIKNGRTYNFEDLPKLLWVATGERLADMKSFETLRRARNSIQHSCAPENIDFRNLSLNFI